MLSLTHVVLKNPQPMLHNVDGILGKHDMLPSAPEGWGVHIKLQSLAPLPGEPVDGEEHQSAALSIPAWTHPLSRRDSCVHGM